MRLYVSMSNDGLRARINLFALSPIVARISFVFIIAYHGDMSVAVAVTAAVAYSTSKLNIIHVDDVSV